MNNFNSKIAFFFVLLVLLGSVKAQDGFKSVLKDSVDHHPSIQSYKAQAESSKRDIDAAKWAFWPTPSVGYETANDVPYGTLDKSSKYFRLQQPIWTSGRLTAQLNKSESQYLVSEAAVSEQKTNIAYKWLQLWAEYQAADEKTKAFKDSVDKHMAYVRQIERRANEGFSAPSDAQLSMSRLSSVQAELRQSQSLKNKAAARLEQMLQKPLASEINNLNDSGWPQSQKAITKWSPAIEVAQLDEYVNLHPTVQKTQILISSAQADVQLASARNIPEVYVRSEMRHGDVTGTHQSIYFGLSSSFGAGLSNASAVAAAQAKVEAYRNELNARQLEVRESIQTDIQDFQAQSDRLGQLEKTFAANRNYLESSERQYLAGRRSWQEIMNIAREESQILAQIADAKAQIWLTHQRLQIFAMGLDTYLSTKLPTTHSAQNEIKTQ
ncbi:TolC family protein [Limnohabitans sp.]|uniref:TolC family protein n=1 Tax=Limnohabitans sp. TaxID=1907725 RepID=UPI00311F8B55